MNTITANDFQAMREDEKEAFIYTILGISKSEMVRLIAEYEYQEGKSPNAILISDKTLHQFHKIGVRIKKLEYGRGKRTPVKLTILPISGAEAQKFILAELDPWDPRWEHLFFS